MTIEAIDAGVTAEAIQDLSQHANIFPEPDLASVIGTAAANAESTHMTSEATDARVAAEAVHDWSQHAVTFSEQGLALGICLPEPTQRPP